ncbi:ZIP family metal transporter [Herbiconiux sp. L3-i23]|uniref:ZIP family metal transporter n=1 Tax=Herbiconiux sp. L3-i23 TaxID=2905871 RepID=UPI002058CE42|nr:ZIP family zinc transporter [Herbiconiux sp. L3-i23]BDI23634.1 ZIP family zinc transporter [Herbiconiux sp. L3-i23]
MSDWLLAGVSGLIGASTLLLGAAIAYFVHVPRSVVAGVMAFGAGVLISALAYELVEEANDVGGLLPTVTGFLAGAVLFVVADWLVSRRGGRGRKNAGGTRAGDGNDSGGSGSAIAVGALIDGIPESIVLGLSVAGGGGLSVPIIAAIAISNIPEGLSSTAGMKADGRRAGYVFGVWGGIAGASTLAALLGYLFFGGAGANTVAFVTTIAAGGILAMLSNTMIPEAFQRDKVLTGLFATAGFLTAFTLHELG